MRLRVKILIGFLILIVILLMADVWTMYRMNRIERSTQTTLDQNYAALGASQTMQKGLSSLDDGFVKILAGQWEQGSRLLASGDRDFQKGLQMARQVLTGSETQRKLAEISANYDRLKVEAAQFHLKILSKKDVRWYDAVIRDSERELKSEIWNLNTIVAKKLYQANDRLKEQTRRTLMPAVVAMLAAVVFLLIFNFFIDYFLLRPIQLITRGVRDLLEKRRPFQVAIQTEDELGELASTIATLCSQTSLGDLEK